MARRTETTSKRWKVTGQGSNAKWDGGPWQSHPPGNKDIDQMAKWIEDMQDWCEMMHESVMELRERMLSVERLDEDLRQLSAVVEDLNSSRPPAARRPE
jgi:hypothetical protein